VTKKHSTLEPTFVELLGNVSGGVISYSSDHENADEKRYPSHSHSRSHHKINDDLIKSGYVIKLIVGKGGVHIRLIDEDQKILAKKLGMFGDRERIYQQLFTLFYIENLYVQICIFTAQGNNARNTIRVDPTIITGKDSDCLALQVCYE
jgi:glutathionylspermidine amidase/synthetase